MLVDAECRMGYQYYQPARWRLSKINGGSVVTRTCGFWPGTGKPTSPNSCPCTPSDRRVASCVNRRFSSTNSRSRLVFEMRHAQHQRRTRL